MISTVMGNGIPGSGLDQLNSPSGLAAGDDGSVYVADNVNQRILRWNPQVRDVTIVAGTTGELGYSGDGGLADFARLNNPQGLAIDDDLKCLYICDFSNNCIRSVDLSTGIINTIVGTGRFGFNGDGLAARQTQLAYPVGVAVDQTGTIFIADQRNQRVRAVDSDSGLVETIAGCGRIGFAGDGGPAPAAELNYPVGVAVDATGACYIADQLGSRIRCVDMRDNSIVTLAGDGEARYGGDGGLAQHGSLNAPTFLALDPLGRFLVISDQWNDRLRVVELKTGRIQTVAGTGTHGFGGDGGAAVAAVLRSPNGIAVSRDSVFFADQGNHRVRRFDVTEILTLIYSVDTSSIDS
jgi:DNA-binding beta-propeller fold protein YncE